jgi:flagellar M-ring protein FliF
VWQSRSPDELRNLTALAQAAVGFDATRGDVLTVEDIGFDANRAEPPPPLPQQLMQTAEDSPLLLKYGALFAGLLVVLAFGVRPALRIALGSPRSRPAGKELTSGASTLATVPLPAGEPVETDPERIRSQEIFDQVTSHLKREPTQSSRLLQSWIHSD